MNTSNVPSNVIIHPPVNVKTYPAKKGKGVKPAYKRRNTGKGVTSYSHGDASFSVWLNLPIGAFAIAHRWPGSWDQSKDPRDIMVRARKRVYLDRLRKQFLPELGPDVGRDGKGTDYGHRAYCTADQLAKAMARMALEIDSPSFKDHCIDNDLHNVYMSMWSSLVKLDDESPYNKPWTGSGGTWGGAKGWWQAPNPLHRPKPSDCFRMGYHWFNAKDGNATCVDCGAERTLVPSTVGHSYRYTYPPGAVVLHTQNGVLLAKNQVKRIPGGTVPLDGNTEGTKPKPVFPSGVKDALSGTLFEKPDKSLDTTMGGVSHGLGYPSTTLPADSEDSATTDGQVECLAFSDHWWAGEGTTICRDCGAGRYLDQESGQFRFTHPVGSVMLTDSDGEPVDDPHVVTDEDAPDDGSEDEAIAADSTELEVFVTP